MKKLRSQSGMTLTEMLCALVVLMLISSLLAVGVRFAVQTYRTSMADSQAQMLCSTVTTAIADKLRYCSGVTSEDGKVFIKDIGSVESDEQGSFFQVDGDTGQIVMQSGSEKKQLLGAKSYPRGLKIRELKVAFSDTDRRFAVSFDVTDTAGTVLASSCFDVRCINDVTNSGTPGGGSGTESGGTESGGTDAPATGR